MSILERNFSFWIKMNVPGGFDARSGMHNGDFGPDVRIYSINTDNYEKARVSFGVIDLEGMCTALENKGWERIKPLDTLKGENTKYHIMILVPRLQKQDYV